MSVIGRLAKVARPFSGSLFMGFAFVFISEILDTAVLTTLFAMLLALVTTASTNGGKIEIPFLNNARGTWFQSIIDNVKPALEQFFASHNSAQVLIWLTVITAGVVFLKFLFDVPGAYLMHKFSNRVGMDLRQKLFDHLLRLSPAYFEKENTGAHMSRITGDVGALQACMGPQLADVLRAVLTIPIALTMMLLVDWKLTLIVLTLAPVIGGIMAVGGRLIRKYSILIQERLGDFNASLVERLGNVRIIQSFVREPFEKKQMSSYNQRYYRETMRAALITETIAPGSETIAIIGMLG
ncbi:MAG: ABC transporter transmembrane domain-containing protein, partial [bacterium]